MYILFEDFPTFKTFLYSKWSKNKKNKEHKECKQFLCLQENKSYSWVKLLQSEVMGMIYATCMTIKKFITALRKMSIYSNNFWEEPYSDVQYTNWKNVLGDSVYHDNTGTFCWSTMTWVCSSCFIRSSYWVLSRCISVINNFLSDSADS